jgi:hypothetical protein
MKGHGEWMYRSIFFLNIFEDKFPIHNNDVGKLKKNDWITQGINVS